MHLISSLKTMCKNANPLVCHMTPRSSFLSLWTSKLGVLLLSCIIWTFIYIQCFLKKRKSSYKEFPLLGQVISAGLCFEHIYQAVKSTKWNIPFSNRCQTQAAVFDSSTEIVAAFQCTHCFSTFTLKTQDIIRIPFAGNVYDFKHSNPQPSTVLWGYLKLLEGCGIK